MSGPTIELPAGYLPASAIGFAGQDGGVLVSASAPLPVTPPSAQAARAVALAGITAASATIGPFLPDLARPIWLTLAGTWIGAAALLRSTDGGATKLAATLAGAPLAWSGNVNEPVAEENCAGAGWYLAVTLTGGALSYRLGQ